MATREKLLSAAGDLFAREGYGAVSRADVAEHAGVGMSTVYHHFPQKRDILFALIDRWEASMPAERRTAFDVEIALQGRPREAARDFLRRSLDQIRRGQSPFRVIVTEAERDPEIRRRYLAAQGSIIEWIAGLLRAGAEAGVIREERDPEVCAFLLHHVMESMLTMVSSRELSAGFREDVIEELAALICDYLVVEERCDEP